jgi:hypothetical protein
VAAGELERYFTALARAAAYLKHAQSDRRRGKRRKRRRRKRRRRRKTGRWKWEIRRPAHRSQTIQAKR